MRRDGGLILPAGQLCALMGPSGSGKTTLLDVLARRPMRGKTVTGSVLVNGAEIPLAPFRAMSCFVEQEDALIGSLTVAETLHFASRLATCPRYGPPSSSSPCGGDGTRTAR